MNKLMSSLLIILITLCSCESDKVAPPVIEIERVIINQDSTVNYKDSLDKLPVLKFGDEVEVSLYLNGNGSSLNTLNVSAANQSVKTSLIPSANAQIAEDKNFTDLENGKMSFVDGVGQCEVKSKLLIISTAEKNIKLSYHLSARAECEGGGILDLEFRTAE